MSQRAASTVYCPNAILKTHHASKLSLAEKTSHFGHFRHMPYSKLKTGASICCCSIQNSERTPSPSVGRQRLFNSIASNYDQLNDLLSLGQHRVWKRMAVSWSGAKIGDTVLDICCGSGDLTFILSEKVGVTGKVIGFDFAAEQLTIAKNRRNNSTNPCYKNIQWIQGDALNLPFPDAEFDAVTCGYGLRNVIDIPQALKEVFRVLKQGSVISALDFNRSLSTDTTSIQEWLLDNIVVPVATSYGLGDEYAYLKSSIANFPTGKQQEKLAKEIGFPRATHYEIGFSFMGVLVATR